jgi:RimJ/RimL family protein N-acetyltransferase
VRTPVAVVLENSYVRLEPLAEQHVTDLLGAAVDDRIWTWLPTTQPTTEAEIRALRTGHPGMPWAVVVDGRAAGSTSYLDVDLTVDGLEIGYTWYRPDLWATKVNPACKLLLLAHAFDDLGAQRVTLKTDGLNTRSQAAIRKLGASYDGTLRHNRRRPDGTVRDTAFFSLLVAEWPAARERLEQRLSS